MNRCEQCQNRCETSKAKSSKSFVFLVKSWAMTRWRYRASQDRGLGDLLTPFNDLDGELQISLYNTLNTHKVLEVIRLRHQKITFKEIRHKKHGVLSYPCLGLLWFLRPRHVHLSPPCKALSSCTSSSRSPCRTSGPCVARQSTKH